MNQAIKTTRMITMGLFTLCTMGLSQATFAGVKTDDPIEFKFVGKLKDRPVFQLNLNNNETEEYLIRIKDENYDVLYSEKVKAKDANFSRKYALDIDEADLNAPGFAVIVEVTSSKTHLTQVYKISSHRSVTANIVIAKL
jgi:hypothetical protein